MTHAISLVFEDGRTVSIGARDDETIVAAAMRERIRLETDCLEGACATCKARITAGRYTLDDYSDEALSDAEAGARLALLCQTHARSDCTIELPYPSAQALARRPIVAAAGRVSAVEPVAAGVVRLEVESAAGAPAAFLPGQYVHLGVPGTEARRSYSMANAPADSRLSFYVKLLDAGLMSDYVRGRAKPGDAITLTGPFGHFYLREVERPVLMIAGGTGLAPMLAMLEHLALAGGTAQPIHLLYGANRADAFFGAALLAQLEQALPLTVERVAFETHGHVTGRLRAELVAGGDRDAYVCGPPPMVEAAQAWLGAHGVEPSRIHNEKFLPS